MLNTADKTPMTAWYQPQKLKTSGPLMWDDRLRLKYRYSSGTTSAASIIF